MHRFLKLIAGAATLCASSMVMASDARSIALGSAVIADGYGVHGAQDNPASLMAMQRRGEITHVRIGFSAEYRDTGDAVDIVTDSENDNLINDIEQEIDNITNQPITCNPFLDDGSTACLTGTQRLSDLSGQLLEIIDVVDGESFEGLGAVDLGLAYTRSNVPLAFNLRISAAGEVTPDISDVDRSYVLEFEQALDNNNLTLDDISNASSLAVDLANGILNVDQPEDVLQSEATGGALVRTQLGLSLATSLAIGGNAVDIGITPKLSLLRARSFAINANDEFLDNVPSVADRFEDSEVEENSFTADIGGSMQLPGVPLRVAAVIRNLIPESIETTDGFEFETTPQLIIGAAFHRRMVSVTGDIAVNEATQDGFSSQKLGIGVEFGSRLLKLRGGIGHDAARSEDSTALTLGFGLGAFEIGGRLSDIESLEFGAQLAFSFR